MKAESPIFSNDGIVCNWGLTVVLYMGINFSTFHHLASSFFMGVEAIFIFLTLPNLENINVWALSIQRTYTHKLTNLFYLITSKQVPKAKCNPEL